MIRSLICTKSKGARFADFPAALKSMRQKRNMTWIDFESPTEAEKKALREKFKFHPLSVDDALNENQRAKIEAYDDYVFIVVRALSKNPEAEGEQLNIFLGKNFLVTFNLRSVPSHDLVFERARLNPNILTRGPDFAVYTILDAIVDEFFPLLQKMDSEVDAIEEDIFKNPSNALLSKLFKLKRRIMLLRRIIWPLRDILNVLARRDFEYVSEKNASYFRDVYDHLIRLTEMTDSVRDLLTASMEGYLSVVSNNLNVIMKKLAAFATILLVPSLIAGIFGMNFLHIPELQSERGFYEALALMFLAVMLLYFYFKRNDWL